MWFALLFEDCPHARNVRLFYLKNKDLIGIFFYLISTSFFVARYEFLLPDDKDTLVLNKAFTFAMLRLEKANEAGVECEF